ncbi:MAG: hypothetical protein A2X09_04555 [Bacteroidetes bacterium GWF2_43_11]|nr:MAG: hypothetical protein A2X09_04555 [Bacteroidetes bacterium GWF2_43_11]
MGKLYGWGASVVIVGALFKITHITGANEMLFVGLITEAVIFFFSAFEKPHVEPDWSLVYPELAGMYHGDDTIPSPLEEEYQKTTTVSDKLDEMFTEAKIDPVLIQSLGDGLRSFASTAKNMNSMADAASVNGEFVGHLKQATVHVGNLSKAYAQTSETLQREGEVSKLHLDNLQGIAKSTQQLNAVYNNVSETMSQELKAHQELKQNLTTATRAAGEMVEKFTGSAETFAKASQTIQLSVSNSESYANQLQTVTKNLTALNALYEVQIKNSQSTNQTGDQTRKVTDLYLASMTEAANNTAKLNQTFMALQKSLDQQMAGTASQTKTSSDIQTAMQMYLDQMKKSIEQASNYQKQADLLTSNITKLNSIYGNMLSAMSVRQG